ncbi:hypothetical protein NW762_012838 [Fusarium torreyae]|uniref:Uncharacterized protein n=1 Tax=Fusarium torreyae TaxID=1237075 RepID=A0A9W8RN95_9HYPO|nr:hypothetical protein NW762_012838 [Fusarium torreyae]
MDMTTDVPAEKSSPATLTDLSSVRGKRRNGPSKMAHTFETFSRNDITDDMLRDAAKLFTENYGTWGHGTPMQAGLVQSVETEALKTMDMTTDVPAEKSSPATLTDLSSVRGKRRNGPSKMAHTFETFSRNDITDDMLRDAAKLFTENYGTWGHGTPMQVLVCQGNFQQSVDWQRIHKSVGME